MRADHNYLQHVSIPPRLEPDNIEDLIDELLAAQYTEDRQKHYGFSDGDAHDLIEG